MGRNSKSRKILTRSESGTCNVCSAPCSSCLHINKGSTSVKAEESSGETCQENNGSQYSGTDVPVKISACDSDKRLAKTKNEERKGKEGLCDSTSCVTGGSDSNQLASSDNKSLGLRHVLDEFSSPKNELIENSFSEDKNERVRPSNLPSTNAKDLNERLGSKEHFSLSSIKEEAFDLDPGQEAIDRCLQKESCSGALEEVCLKLEEERNTGNSVASEKVGLKLDSETQTDGVTGYQPNKVVNSSMQIKENEKTESWELSDVQENNMESQSMIDSDESDVLEHDVKVCDICGDAGREDKLAICSRCSDGAEHTYCMREMIDKVPEGDWLCEECKAYDEIKSKGAVVAASGSGKYQFSEVSSAEDTDVLSVDGKELDAEANRTRKKLSGKGDMDDRRSEDIETLSDAKKQALGPTVESPRAPHRVSSLSRDSSFKNPNKDELRPPQSYSADNEISEDATSLRGLRQQIARKHLSKSSSFCTNVKSNSDFFNEVPQRQKSARESTYTIKEGGSKLIGRSMSFKPSTSSRLNSSESKVKMLSSNFPHPQDVKGLRQTKAQNILERKSSFRPEGMGNNADQKLAPSDPIVSNSSELKGVLANSKPSILSKSASHTARKGEMKISSVSEQRPKETGLRDDSSSGIHTTEKLFCKSRGGLPGILPRPQETESFGERNRESFVSRSRTSIDSPRDIVNDASAARSSADVIKGNKLKAAIEAAMLKKPGICRKNRPADQSDEAPMPSTNLNSETPTEDHLLAPSKRKPTSIANEAHEEQATSSNGDQNSLPLRVASLNVGGSCAIISSGASNQPSATVSVLLKIPVLPEHEYTWQGGFDIRKIGKLANLRDGLQAHLSTFASPKVLEVVNKFPSKLLLNEVPRLSTWPVQFQEAGVKEENIALYFFAKDLDSYERSYKSLLEAMMRRDVALKGNFDGVDLLIFPSNHLPQNAQRWNMLYFLWGVFRKQKVSVQNVSDSNAFNALKVSECPTTVELPGKSGNLNADSQNSAFLALEGYTSENIEGLRNAKISSGVSHGPSLQGNVEKQDSRVDAKRIRGLLVSETKGATIPLEEKVELKTNIKPVVAKLPPSVQDAKTNFSNIQQSSSSSGTVARVSPFDAPETLKRTVKEEEESTCAISFRERNIMVDRATKERNESQFSHGKRPHEIPISSNLASTLLAEGESANKKQKTDSSVIGSAENNIEGETNLPKRGFELDLNEAQDYTPDSPSPAAKQEKGCLFDLNIAQDYPPDNDDEEDGSLSLPFQFPKKDPEVMPMSNIEPALPGRPNTRSSRLFLDGLSK